MPDQFFHANTRLKLINGDMTTIKEQCLGNREQTFECCSHRAANNICEICGEIVDSFSTRAIDTYFFSNGGILKCTPECRFMTSRRVIKSISEFNKKDAFYVVNYRNGYPLEEILNYDDSQPGYLHISGHVRSMVNTEELFTQLTLEDTYKNFIIGLNNYVGILAFPSSIN